jgi:hypothetical protein
MTMSDPWEDIGEVREEGRVRLRRADPGHPLDWYRGKDVAGRYLFLLQVVDEETPRTKLPVLGNMDVRIDPLQNGRWQLVLVLKEPSQSDIFRVLCSDLMEATRSRRREESSGSVEIVLTRLQRWQEMLRASRLKLLSMQQRIGLFGELLFLRDEVMQHRSALDAVRTWRGIHADEQDFVVGDWRLEIKTQHSSADRIVHISSAAQLDPGDGRLALVHQMLGVFGEADADSASLNGLVSQLTATLAANCSGASDILQAALIDYGYVQREEYDEPLWKLTGIACYLVESDFPRIVPGMLPAGIHDVQYRLDIDSCARFRIDVESLRTQVFGDHD